MQVKKLAFAAALFILCAKAFASEDPRYLICKQLLNQIGAGEAITYDEWSQAQPNPLLIGYKWKVHVELESIVPGWGDEKMTADGELEITDKYVECGPDLIGKYDATVKWKAGPNPYCNGHVFGGTVTDTGEIDGVAVRDHLNIYFNGISKKAKYTDKCPFGDVNHDKDFHLVSSPSHEVQYKDGEDTVSNPYFHYISKLKIQAECPVDLTVPSPLIVNVKAIMPSVTHNHSLTGAQIKNLVSRPTSLADNAGLTQLHVSPKLSRETSGSDARFGSRKCIWVDQIDVDISYPPVTMYIATEYPVGSCNYNVTLTHENEHIQVAKDLLAKHAARIRTELEKATMPNKNMAMVVNNFDSGQSQIDILLKEIVNPLIQNFKKEIKDEFVKLDSPANYQLVLSQCPSW